MDPAAGSFPLWSCVGIAACVLLSALFSGTETVLTSLTPRITLQLMEQGGKSAAGLALWRDESNRVLSALLVGNNLVNIAASVLSVHVASWFFAGMGPSGSAWADAASVVGMTLILLIFAEVSPKTYAKHNARQLAVPAIRFVQVVRVPLAPAAWVMDRLGRGVMSLLGKSPPEDAPPVTEQDIEYMIELGAREEVFAHQGRGELLEAALEFGEVLVKEVMIPRTQTLMFSADTRLAEALEQLITRGHSRVPVYDGSLDQIVGLLYAKDLLKALGTSGQSQGAVHEVMRTPVWFVPESQRIAETLREMQRRRIHLGVVVDEFGGVSGIVTVEDILEELVGEIRDEYDHEEDRIREVAPGRYEVDALISLRDLEDALGVPFPDDGDYETLGGFVVAQLGRVPEPGATFQRDRLTFRVTQADRRRVERMQIERSQAPEPDG